MTREELYNELQTELIQRFQSLNEEDLHIIRKNVSSEYALVVRKLLGDKIMSGIPRIKSLNEKIKIRKN